MILEIAATIGILLTTFYTGYYLLMKKAVRRFGHSALYQRSSGNASRNPPSR